jgi:acyl carrier protein
MSTERAVANRDEVFQAVQAIVAECAQVPLDAVTEEAHLENDLGCDSLTEIEITMQIEDRFDIVVPDDSVADQLLVVGALVDEVLELLRGSMAVSPA